MAEGKRGYPFEFSTEASINLADDAQLLQMMREANFFAIFVGIESPDTATLISMQKKQNTRRSLADSVHKIYGAGMFVTAGFIVGFDTEKGSVAEGHDRMHRGDRHSGLHGRAAHRAAEHAAHAPAGEGGPPAAVSRNAQATNARRA